MRSPISLEEMNRQHLLSLLKYQVLKPRITTMGICPTGGCGTSSRGSAICAKCLIKEMVSAGISEGTLWTWTAFARRSMSLMWDIEEQIENLGNKQTIEDDDEKDLDLHLSCRALVGRLELGDGEMDGGE